MMQTCPFDMVAVGNAINNSLAEQGFAGCKFIVIVVDRDDSKAIASNLLADGCAKQLLVEAAMILDMADVQDEQAGHA